MIKLEVWKMATMLILTLHNTELITEYPFKQIFFGAARETRTLMD